METTIMGYIGYRIWGIMGSCYKMEPLQRCASKNAEWVKCRESMGILKCKQFREQFLQDHLVSWCRETHQQVAKVAPPEASCRLLPS